MVRTELTADDSLAAITGPQQVRNGDRSDDQDDRNEIGKERSESLSNVVLRQSFCQWCGDYHYHATNVPKEARSKRTVSVVNGFSSHAWNTLVTHGPSFHGTFHIRLGAAAASSCPSFSGFRIPD
jgi:hypothetical protein